MRKVLIPIALVVLSVHTGRIDSEAQEPYAPESVSAQDYARAEGFLNILK